MSKEISRCWWHVDSQRHDPLVSRWARRRRENPYGEHDCGVKDAELVSNGPSRTRDCMQSVSLGIAGSSAETNCCFQVEEWKSEGFDFVEEWKSEGFDFVARRSKSIQTLPVELCEVVVFGEAKAPWRIGHHSVEDRLPLESPAIVGVRLSIEY